MADIDIKVHITLADPAARALTPEQREEFNAQVAQADPLRILEIVRRTLQAGQPRNNDEHAQEEPR